jgi:hypothetical protein
MAQRGAGSDLGAAATVVKPPPRVSSNPRLGTSALQRGKAWLVDRLEGQQIAPTVVG